MVYSGIVISELLACYICSNETNLKELQDNVFLFCFLQIPMWPLSKFGNLRHIILILQCLKQVLRSIFSKTDWSMQSKGKLDELLFVGSIAFSNILLVKVLQPGGAFFIYTNVYKFKH